MTSSVCNLIHRKLADIMHSLNKEVMPVSPDRDVAKTGLRVVLKGKTWPHRLDCGRLVDWQIVSALLVNSCGCGLARVRIPSVGGRARHSSVLPSASKLLLYLRARLIPDHISHQGEQTSVRWNRLVLEIGSDDITMELQTDTT